MNKKAIAILGAIFILIVGTLGILIYSRGSGSKTAVNNPAPTPTPTPTPTEIVDNNNNQQNQTNQNQSTSKIFKLTDDQVVSPALTFNGQGVAYFTKSGELYRAQFDVGSSPLQFGDKKQLAIDPKPGINKVIWPVGVQDFMLEYNNFGKRSYEFYDNTLGKFTMLPSQVYSLGFLPSSDPQTVQEKVYFVWSSQSGNDTVNVSDPTTAKYKTVSEIWDKNALVYVSPDGVNVLYHKDPATVSSSTNPLVLTDVDGKTWRKVVDGFVSGVLWSPDGKKFLFGKKDPGTQKFQIWYADLLAGEIRNLGINTKPEKCVWTQDSQQVYAAVPHTGDPGSGLTMDNFVRINPVSGEKKDYSSGDKQIDGEDLFLNQAGDKLMFRNAQDGGLYYLDLSQ